MRNRARVAAKRALKEAIRMPKLTALTNPAFLAGLKGIIFDCDGVLFDSMGSNRLYYNAILERLGLGPMTAEQEAYVHAHAVHQSLAYIVPEERWDDIDTARSQVDYRAEILPHLKPEPGLYELLGRLREQGYLLGISTNRTSTMGWLVQRFGLDRFFAPIVTASDVRPKPHPESLNLILRRWGLAPQQTAFVGDSKVDMLTANAAGVRFWAFRNPWLPSELQVDDFWDMARGMRLGASFAGYGCCGL